MYLLSYEHSHPNRVKQLRETFDRKTKTGETCSWCSLLFFGAFRLCAMEGSCPTSLLRFEV
jgi:hypothetical protein